MTTVHWEKEKMRLIDADKIVYSWTIDNDGEEHDGVTLQSIIDKMPTIDAVPVVRCKDCKWWDDFPIASATPYIHECSASYPRRGTCADDYCSWGERREDGKAD